MEIATQYLTLGMLIFSILQILATLPFWKYLLKLRDTVVSVDSLEKSLIDNINKVNKTHDDFKTVVRNKFEHLEKELAQQKETHNSQMNAIQREVNSASLKLSESIGTLTGLIIKLEGTLNGFKTSMDRGEETLKSKIDALSRELQQHKDTTREYINELKQVRNGH